MTTPGDHTPDLPFEPTPAPAPEPSKPRIARRERAKYGSLLEIDRLSVSQLSRLVDSALKDRLPRKLRVVGEMSGFTQRSHWYFSLKDQDAVISCVMFASAAKRAKFTPGDGQEVLVTGRIEHYAKQGRTQLYADSIEPIGAGELDQRFRALCSELRTLGWFDEARKRPLPTFPARIAIVTSKTGAAIHDVLATLEKRCPAIEALLVDTHVQGEQAAPEIARVIKRISRERAALGVDAILVTRGGGSMEDLWAFNERIVAEAIHACDLPVVAAIGHESDVTIAELVADVRAATPTQAAMLLSPDRESLLEQIDLYESRLASSLRRRAMHDRQRLRAVRRRRIFTDPMTLLQAPSQRHQACSVKLAASMRLRLLRDSACVDRLASLLARHQPAALHAARAASLDAAAKRFAGVMRSRVGAMGVQRQRRELERAWRVASQRRSTLIESLSKQLDATGPINVLRRGYSVTTHEDGSLVREAGDVTTGQTLRTRLASGAFTSIVEKISQSETSEQNQPPRSEDRLFDEA